MEKRLFLAILLPGKIKEGLIKVQKEQKKLNICWTKKENLHFTLLFLGKIEQEKIEKIKKALKKVAKNTFPFYIEIKKIVPGPSKEKPRMIWAKGSLNEKIINLRKDIINSFKEEKIEFKNDHKFNLHITLARARKKELHERKIEQNLNLIFPVKEFFLMESELKKEGPKYIINSRFKLKGRD